MAGTRQLGATASVLGCFLFEGTVAPDVSID